MTAPIKCPQCPKWFVYQKDLDAHVWVEHMTEEQREFMVKNRKPKPRPPDEVVFRGFTEEDD